MKSFLFLVNEKFNNVKVVDYLKALGVSAEIIKKIKQGHIEINGKTCQNVNDRLKQGQVLKINLPPDKTNQHITPIKAPIKVLYEDEHILAVLKEKGELTHNARSNATISLDQKVCGYFLPNEFTFRAINRLDRDTKGIVLIAKDMLTASLLGEQMKAGNIKKTYVAIVKGRATKKHFTIEKPIKRESPEGIKRVVDDGGKYALTECWVLEEKNGLTTLKILLHTGRTHQIRVHLASIGLPLYADALYGEKVQGENYSLTAKTLEFTHPFTKKRIKLEC